MEESRLVSMYSSPTTAKVKAVSLDLDRWSRVVALWQYDDLICTLCRVWFKKN